MNDLIPMNKLGSLNPEELRLVQKALAQTISASGNLVQVLQCPENTETDIGPACLASQSLTYAKRNLEKALLLVANLENVWGPYQE